MRGAISKKRGSQPRWPENAEGMERSKRARRRKLETAKTDLKPPLAVLRRAGCPSRGGIRRACGEVPSPTKRSLSRARLHYTTCGVIHTDPQLPPGYSLL